MSATHRCLRDVRTHKLLHLCAIASQHLTCYSFCWNQKILGAIDALVVYFLGHLHTSLLARK